MKSFISFVSEEMESKQLVVRFKNVPSTKAAKLLVETASMYIEEGKSFDYDKRHNCRLDRRPDSIGGSQLHIERNDGTKWAYRDNGMRSERNKYTTPATNIVKDIVAKTFKIDRSQVEEAYVVKADKDQILIEVVFS